MNSAAESERQSFICRVNARCRVISGDYRGPILRRLGFRTALLLLKICTAFIMTMIGLAGVRDIPDFCDVSINLMSFVTIEVYAFLFVIRGQEFNGVVKKLSSLWLDIKAATDTSTPTERRLVRRCDRIVRGLVPLLNGGALAIMVGYSTAPIIIFLTSTDEKKRIGLPFKMAKFIDEAEHSTVIFVYVIAVIALTYSTFIIININALYLSVLCTMQAGLQLSSLFLCRAYENRGGPMPNDQSSAVTAEQLRRRLKFRSCLIQHQQWLRAAFDLKRVMNTRFLVLHMGTITVATLGSFLTAYDPTHHYYQIAMALIPLSIYFIFFFMATHIAATSESTAELLYFCHMRMLPLTKSGSATILFIMQRAQKPVSFQIGKIWHLSLIRFVAILQNIYSVIMLLRTISNQPSSPEIEEA